jgi:hypothetical protein
VKSVGGKQNSEKLSKTLGNAKGANATAGNRSATHSETEVSYLFNSFLYSLFHFPKHSLLE